MARRHTTSSLTRETEREETGGKKEGKEAGKKEKRGSELWLDVPGESAETS